MAIVIIAAVTSISNEMLGGSISSVAGVKKPIYSWSLIGGSDIVRDLVANTRSNKVNIKPTMLETGKDPHTKLHYILPAEELLTYTCAV